MKFDHIEHSMDNELIFGEIIFTYTFKQAINDGYIVKPELVYFNPD